jgi:hypothetical protein
MSIASLFWIIIILGFVFGFVSNRASARAWLSSDLAIWVLILLLGWAVFGAPLHR